jgi:hypothetical protein
MRLRAIAAPAVVERGGWRIAVLGFGGAGLRNPPGLGASGGAGP